MYNERLFRRKCLLFSILVRIISTQCNSRILPPSSPSQPMPPTSFVLSPTMRNFIRCAGLSGTLAICLGVYGAHIMKETTSDELRRVCFERKTIYFACVCLVISIGSNISSTTFSRITCGTICVSTKDHWTFIHRWNFTLLWSNVLSCYTK